MPGALSIPGTTVSERPEAHHTSPRIRSHGNLDRTFGRSVLYRDPSQGVLHTKSLFSDEYGRRVL